MYDIQYLSPDGKYFPLTQDPINLLEGGLEGLTGACTDQPLIMPGVPGQLVSYQTIEATKGTLKLLITTKDTAQAHSLLTRLRKAFHPRKHGVLTISTRWGRLSAHIRADGPIPPPIEVENHDRIEYEMPIAVICDDGLWWQSYESADTRTTIVNHGDVIIYPTISWKNTGGDVILPSGAHLRLPTINTPRRLLLSPLESNVILDEHDQIDYPAWQQIPKITEGIEAGGKATYQIPNGAKISWRIGVLDPWQ